MREGKKPFDINPRRTAESDIKSLIGGHGHIPDEFRPLEEVEEEKMMKGPQKHVDLNEIAQSAEGEGGEYLTPEDKMAAELDRKRLADEEEAVLAHERGEDEADLANISTDKDETGGSSIVLEPLTKKDVKIVRGEEFSKKSQRALKGWGKHPAKKPRYKDVGGK